MKTCAVIPAAGRGSRLNTTIPKILLPLTSSKTIWSILRDKLIELVDHIHVIVSPQARHWIQNTLIDDIQDGLVSLSVQKEPIGMGDAIVQGYSVWSEAEQMLVVWSDQVFVSQDTLKRSLEAHAGCAHTIALPLTHVAYPYVEYIFDTDFNLTAVKQSREGDSVADEGLADVGTFVMSVDGLLPAWHTFLKSACWGSKTHELNFLPFLPFLAEHGWQIKPVNVMNTLEARGINTPDDLLFFRKLYEGVTS